MLTGSLSVTPLWHSEVPSPSLSLPSLSLQARAWLTCQPPLAWSDSAGAHGLPKPGQRALVLLGGVFGFVGAPWSSCLLPSSWKADWLAQLWDWPPCFFGAAFAVLLCQVPRTGGFLCTNL